MAAKPQPTPSAAPIAPANAPRRGSAFRGGDAKDPMVELTERAKLISQEAGTKVSTAMRDMISAAAGIAGFAVESARDLVQFMVRRGQMTQDEGDKLLREAESSHSKRPAAERKKPTASEIANKERLAQRAKAAEERERMMAQHIARIPIAHAATAKKSAPPTAKMSAPPTAKKSAPSNAKKAARPAAKPKTTAKK